MALKVDPATLSPSGWWRADALTGADGSLVASFTDSSGNGRHLTQSTDGLKPKLRLWQDANQPAPSGGPHKSVRFDGTNDFLQSGVNLSTFLGTDGLGTIIALVRFQKNVVPSTAAYGIFGVNAATGTKLTLRYDLAPEVFQAQNNDGAPDVAAMKGWRYDMFGAQAEQLKRGELALKLDKGEVVPIELEPAASESSSKARASR